MNEVLQPRSDIAGKPPLYGDFRIHAPHRDKFLDDRQRICRGARGGKWPAGRQQAEMCHRRAATHNGRAEQTRRTDTQSRIAEPHRRAEVAPRGR